MTILLQLINSIMIPVAYILLALVSLRQFRLSRQWPYLLLLTGWIMFCSLSIFSLVYPNAAARGLSEEQTLEVMRDYFALKASFEPYIWFAGSLVIATGCLLLLVSSKSQGQLQSNRT